MERKVFGRLKNVDALDCKWTFELTKAGLAVRKKHSKKVRLVGFDTLANLGRREPVLFPELKQ